MLIEAIRQQRNAAAVIGHHPEHAREISQRIDDARQHGAQGVAVLLRGDPPELPRLLAEQAEGFLRRHRHAGHGVCVHPGGSADLILVSLPAVLLLGHRQRRTRKWHQQFSALDVLTASAIVLRPGGFLAITCGAEHEATARDLGGGTVSLCAELGLAYWQHIVALLVPINDSQLKPRRPRRRAQPELPRIVHADIHVFRKPTAARRCAADEDELAARRRR